MGKSWENHEKIMGKQWENHGKHMTMDNEVVMGNSLNYAVGFPFLCLRTGGCMLLCQFKIYDWEKTGNIMRYAINNDLS
jgi:hypothetical protein